MRIIAKALFATMVTFLEDDATLEDVKSLLAKQPLAAVVATASYSAPCKPMVEKLKESSPGGGCCGGSPYEIVVLPVDASDEMEDLAVELGLDGIPSFQIYKSGAKLQQQPEVDESGEPDPPNDEPTDRDPRLVRDAVFTIASQHHHDA